MSHRHLKCFRAFTNRKILKVEEGLYYHVMFFPIFFKIPPSSWEKKKGSYTKTKNVNRSCR